MNSWFAISEKSYIKECQEKNLPLGSMPILSSLGIQPNCLKVHYSESGLSQAKAICFFGKATDQLKRLI